MYVQENLCDSIGLGNMVYCQIEPTYLPLGFSIAMKHFFSHKCSFNNNINNNKLNNRTTRITAAKPQQKQRKQHHEKQQQSSSFPEILTLSSACNSARLGRRSLSSVCDFEFQDLKFKSYHIIIIIFDIYYIHAVLEYRLIKGALTQSPWGSHWHCSVQ